MKKLAVLLLLVAVMAGMASAQGYEMGKTSVGPLLGIGPNGLAIGGQGEYGFNKNISIGGLVSYSSKSEKYDYWYYSYTWKLTYITIGAQGNYHFKPAQQFDPFVGLIVGYDIVSATVEWDDPTYESYYGNSVGAAASELVIGGNIGANYYFNKGMAGVARVGYPFYISAGVNFVF